MAKEATPLTAAKFPEDLPKGILIEHFPRTVSGKAVDTGKKDDKGKPIMERPSAKVNVAAAVPGENTAEGLRNYIAMLSEVAKAAGLKDDNGNVVEDYGVQFACGALRSAVASGLGAKLTPTTAKDAGKFIPPIPNTRTVDPFEAATSKVAEEYKAALASGKKMSEADIAKRFSALMGG